ncbi:hypothetical protein L861_18450 [Litchfieldella anticariensis FP35 = DSM 16096]|uniref:Uncharacterized protein n=1 Tax=Litchfieldella anticariensis (strain DSM 16096 / CECT 5854 / CIP 108499 / LMG 22089 / FP35) TaxID=1121939 RepID=S2L6U6_LITA3|nr:hypothetical protein [Halomonas anticariensis]EPC03519.1 hypothetical protein L861_18450 [Halomonas anticariensis FP35 = DSM 16096]
MDSKYKTRSFRLTLLFGAGVLALLALRATQEAVQALLWLGALWLIGTATLHELSQRWPTHTPWQLVPTLLLASLLWLSPLQFACWLWAFAILLILPQPWWLVTFNILLATLSWWRVQAYLSTEQSMSSALILAALMLLGLIRSLYYRPLWQGISERVRLMPGTRLWTASQLLEDLPRESARSDREATHTELVLLRTQHRYCWSLAQALSRQLQPFEHCYRVDGRTLATLLTSRDIDHARQRRDALLASLHGPRRTRVISLACPLTLDAECEALAKQSRDLVIIEKVPSHA